MKCRECTKEDHQSRVIVGPTYTQLMAIQEHYDEDGVYHIHDLNERTTEYRCSRGHVWSEKSTHQCPNCDWPSVAIGVDS